MPFNIEQFIETVREKLKQDSRIGQDHLSAYDRAVARTLARMHTSQPQSGRDFRLQLADVDAAKARSESAKKAWQTRKLKRNQQTGTGSGLETGVVPALMRGVEHGQ